MRTLAIESPRALAEAMYPVAVKVLLDPPHFDFIKSGIGDTGTIVLESDLSLSRSYLAIAQRAGMAAFTEEDDPLSPSGVPLRVNSRSVLQFDPVDGSGDRKRGESSPGTAAAEGYASLSSHVVEHTVRFGICIRPSPLHREVWLFTQEGIELFSLSPDYSQLHRTEFRRVERLSDAPLRVNFRPAYPDTNFPDEVLELACELSRGRYRFEWRECGGAADSICRLLKGELDIVVSGRKTDWKSWDTDPFSLGVNHLAGRMTRYDGAPLDRVATRDLDLWHSGGVIASIDCAEAHDVFCKALRKSEERWERRDQRPLVYDPRRVSR